MSETITKFENTMKLIRISSNLLQNFDYFRNPIVEYFLSFVKKLSDQLSQPFISGQKLVSYVPAFYT